MTKAEAFVELAKEMRFVEEGETKPSAIVRRKDGALVISQWEDVDDATYFEPKEALRLARFIDDVYGLGEVHAMSIELVRDLMRQAAELAVSGDDPPIIAERILALALFPSAPRA